jgi:hypothetical protein
MYSKKDLMPIKPEGHLFLHPKSYWTLNSRTKEQFGWTIDSTPFSSKTTEWIIPIPGAPGEVKPVEYPANKPSEDGKYICHIKYWLVDGYALPLPEEWMIVGWDGDDWECVRKRVDYFIPIRLDEPVRDTNKLESEEDVSDEGVIWRDEHIKICSLDGFDDTYYIGSTTDPERYVFLTDEQLAACKDAVVKREQIAPCPFCKAFVEMEHCYISDKKEFYLVCDDCGYCSCHVESESEAIRLHNQIAGR